MKAVYSSTLYPKEYLCNAAQFASKTIRSFVPIENKVCYYTPILEYFAILLGEFNISENERRSCIEFSAFNFLQVRSRLAYSYLVASLVDRFDVVHDYGSYHGMVGHLCSQKTTSKVLMLDCDHSSWLISRKLHNSWLTSPFSGKDLSSNIFHMCGAVSTNFKVSQFWRNLEKSVGSSLHKELVSTPGQPFDVPVYSYLDIFNLFPPDVVKMNVEGEDTLILLDYLKSIMNSPNVFPRSFIIEVAMTDSLVELLSYINSYFNSAYLIEFTQSLSDPPFDFQDTLEFIRKPSLKPHHLLISMEPSSLVLKRLSDASAIFKSHWSFLP